MKRVLVLIAILFAAAGVGRAADIEPTADMFSMAMEPAGTTEVAPGAVVEYTMLLSTETVDLQGWSAGICFDTDVLTISKVDDAWDHLIDGTGAAEVNAGSPPDMMFISGPGDIAGGLTVGVVIHIMSVNVLPPTENFSILKIPFEVIGNPGDSTEIAYCDDLNDPPVETIVVTDGKSFNPAVQTGATLNVAAIQPGLSLAELTDGVCADETSEAQVAVALGLPADAGSSLDIQGWSYGVSHNGDELVLVDIVATQAVNELNGGNPPDFQGYKIDPVGGTGGTVGVAISMSPEFHVLTLNPGDEVHTETFVYRSAMTLEQGANPMDTDIALVDKALGDPPVAAVVSIASADVDVSLGAPIAVTLEPCDEVNPPLPFLRGDANNDSIVNIADGIWILSYKFRGGDAPPCLDAADADDNGEIDINDAILVIYYRLLGGDAPAAPFLACGTDPSDTDRDNPEDGLSCMVAGAACP